MFRALRRLVRRLKCKRHRWRPDRRRPGIEFCDLCQATRQEKDAAVI